MSRYRPLRQLGCSLAVTELAQDELTGREVIRRRFLKSDLLACRQCARESDLLLKLNGQNAPVLYECLETGKEKILIEEYIRGTPARDLTRKEKKQVLEKLKGILDSIHRQGYLYLDLKEDHLIQDGNRLVLIDYDSVMETGSRQCFFATRTFMAPELAQNVPKTEAADNWAWAMLAKEWGLLPFKARGCLDPDPSRRPTFSGNPGPVFCSLIWLAAVSVFAVGLCLPAAGAKEPEAPESMVSDVILNGNLEPDERFRILEHLEEPLDEGTVRKLCEMTETDEQAARLAAYALRMKTKGCEITLPEHWANRFSEEVSQLMKWKEELDD